MFSCKLSECQPGLFIFEDCLGLMTEYRKDGFSEAYIVETGEYFWGGAKNKEDRENLLVTPVILTDGSALRLAGVQLEDE